MDVNNDTQTLGSILKLYVFIFMDGVSIYMPT